jgi:hypothetical protein
MNYTILGCITKYSPNDIRPYIESINQSGFKGKKVMLVYDIPKETIEYLKQNGWELYGGVLKEHVIIQRFVDVYKLLENFGDDVIIWTDVKDIIFQKDPSVWLDTYKHKEILACSESIVFKDEDWAVVNAGTSFPIEWEWLQNKQSYCAGCIIGNAYALKDLFIEIYHWTKTTANPGQLSDQAAYNVLINLNHFKENVQFVKQEEGLATQLGTVLNQKYRNTPKLTEPSPLFVNNQVVNQEKEPFCIVHQYDRYQDIKNVFIEKYK